MTRDDLGKCRSFVVIIRAIHERGIEQEKAKRELQARGLWLSPEQEAQSLRGPTTFT